MSRYNQLYDGEWIRPIRHGFKDCCCDCGLVHRVDFRIKDGKIEFRCFRDPRATSAVRRSLKGK